MNKILDGIKLLLLPVVFVCMGLIILSALAQFNNANDAGIIETELTTNQLLFFIGMPTALLLIIAGFIFLDLNLLNNRLDKVMSKGDTK